MFSLKNVSLTDYLIFGLLDFFVSRMAYGPFLSLYSVSSAVLYLHVRIVSLRIPLAILHQSDGNPKITSDELPL